MMIQTWNITQMTLTMSSRMTQTMSLGLSLRTCKHHQHHRSLSTTIAIRHLLPRHCHLQHNCLQRHCRPSRPTLEESEAMEVVGEGDKPSRHRLLDIVGKAKIGGYANDFTKFAADMEIMIAHVLTFKEITSAEYIEGRIRGLGGLASAKDVLRTLVMRSC